jgi:hypothetical protein
MSCFAFPSLLSYWVLDLTLAPVFPLVSCQAIFIRMPFLPDLELVLAGFLGVQFIHIRRFYGGVDLAVCLKFQIVRYVG